MTNWHTDPALHGKARRSHATHPVPDASSVMGGAAPRVQRVRNDERSNTGAASQDAPTQTAHRTLGKRSRKHKIRLPTFFFTVANKSPTLLGSVCSSWRPLEGCNYHREGPQTYPKFEPRTVARAPSSPQPTVSGGWGTRPPVHINQHLPFSSFYTVPTRLGAKEGGRGNRRGTAPRAHRGKSALCCETC